MIAAGMPSAVAAFFARLGPEMLLRTRQHLVLTVTAVLIACALAIPLGIFLARCRRKWVVFGVIGLVNVIQPIPSLAMVAFVAVVFLSAGLPTIGLAPGLVALVAYALLPILRNTYTGIRQVDATIIEVATGMGMTRRQILLSVELPLALPFIMAGVRIATVWTIGVAALVALVGAGGLGDLIFKGLRSYRTDLLLAGSAPASAMALLMDYLLNLMEKWLTPSGVQPFQPI